MQTTREPYEFLARWVPAGAPENPYAGTVQAQINFAFVTRDDAGVVASWTPDPKGPFPVALNGTDGIPLGDIFPALNAAMAADVYAKELAATEAINARVIAEDTLAADAAAHAKARASVVDLTAALAAAEAEAQRVPGLMAQVSALQAQVDAATAAPAPVTRMQAVLALHDAGLLAAVEAIVAQAGPRVQLAWTSATEFHRSSPLIAQLWAALGKTEAELDALFAAARLIAV